jgi:hypothetical protein
MRPALATAKVSFEKHLTEFLQTLIAETKRIVLASFGKLEDLDDNEITEAISMIGKTAVDLPKIGKLIDKGLTLAMQALQKLNSLLGPENTQALQKQLNKIIEQVKAGGDPLEKFLNHSYGIATTEERVRNLLKETSADSARIDDGTRRLAELQNRFTEHMALINRIVDALSTGKRFAGMFLPGVTVAMLFGGSYLIAMLYSVLAAMDFADTTTLITIVPGAVKIVEETLT